MSKLSKQMNELEQQARKLLAANHSDDRHREVCIELCNRYNLDNGTNLVPFWVMAIVSGLMRNEPIDE